MAGIYIHIPFCKKRCSYCDFYTEVAPMWTSKIISCIEKELILRRNYLDKEEIETIYFGGGTPSLLTAEQFKQIFDCIYQFYTVSSRAEITFEANPDDLTDAFFSSIQTLPFNRISIGIQSFHDSKLQLINRRHSGQEAIDAVKKAQCYGFRNISIDLIYGLPSQTLQSWELNLKTALKLGIQHISAYGLTYEEGTVLWKKLQNGEIEPIDDDTMNKMYDILRDLTSLKGFEAYEVSNFALPGYRSQHNTSYWQQKKYLGVGPSAHSYNIDSRQWNIASLQEYAKALESGNIFFEIEELSTNDRYNDLVMTSLRTSEGIDLKKLEQQFGDQFVNYCFKSCQRYIENNDIIIVDNHVQCTIRGIRILNLILIDLMKV